MSEKVTIEEKKLSRTPSFEINPLNGTSGIAFAGIPLGHEFSSFCLPCYRSVVVLQKSRIH